MAQRIFYFLCIGIFIQLIHHQVNAQSPGAVSANLELWLKADAGVEEAASDPAEIGDNILNWLDQSGNSNDFTNDFGSAPSYINYNNEFFLDFSQVGSDYLRGPSVFSGTGARTMIIVGQPTSLSSAGANNCMFQLAPNESTGQGYSLFLEAPLTNSGLACRVSGNKIMDYTTSTTIPSIFVVQNGASENVTATDFYVNGGELTSLVTSSAAALNTSSLGTIIGGFSSSADNNPTASFDFNGFVSEIIVYSNELSNTDRNAVESYLNIKYGITIDVASHDFYSQAAYPNDIAGIGQDITNQGLSEDSSWSINSGSILTVCNPTSLDDGDYLVWGHDGGSGTSFSNSGIPASLNFRLERIWRVNETGETGDLTMKVYLPGISQCGSTLAPSAFKLLVDNSDTDFSDASSTDATSYANDTLIFTNINLSNDDHFTIAIDGFERPGDVGNDLVFWLRGDCGVEEAVGDTAELGDNILNWKDQSGLGNDVTNDFGSAPVLGFDAGNFGVDFSGLSAYLRGSSVLSGTGERTFIVVGQVNSISNATTNCIAALAPNNTSGTGYGMFWEEPGASGSNGLAVRVAGNKVMDYTIATASPNFVQISNGVGENVTDAEFYANGQLVTELETQSAATINTNSLGTIIGGFSTGGDLDPEASYDFDGIVFEVLAYDREITCVERKQLDFYFSDKYGITLDYFDETSSGSNGIDGNVDGLIKKYGSFADISTASSGEMNLSDVSFLSDAGDALFVANDGAFGILDSDIPAGAERRLNRVWYADYTSCNANSGNVTLSFDLSSLPCDGFDAPANPGNYRLLVSNSTSFAGATEISGASLNGNAIEITLDVSNLNDQYFTLSTNDNTNSPLWWSDNGPLGINDGLVLWLKSDCSVEEAIGDLAENGDNVLFWRDQSESGNDVSNDIGAAPIFQTVGGFDAIDFSAGSSYLRGPSVISGTGGRTVFVAAYANSLSSGNGNSVLSLAPNVSTGTGYGLSFESSGGSNGLGVRVSGNKVMNYDVPTGQATVVSIQSGDNSNVTDTEFYVDGESVTDVQASSSAALNTDAQGIIIGGWSTDGDIVPDATWDFDGAIYEIIVYNRAVSCDERDSIHNYLANKYSTSIFYTEVEKIGDNGISTDIDTIDINNSSGLSQAMTITDVSAITDCIDTIYFANDNATGVTEQADDVDMSGLSGTNVERWTRKWYALNVSNDADPDNVQITFDLDDYPISSNSTVSGTRYRLINRTTGAWAITTVASGPTLDVGENTVSFEVDIDNINKREFTLVTLDSALSPLPNRLIDFNGFQENSQIVLKWSVLNEMSDSKYILEKSSNAKDWNIIQQIKVETSSNLVKNYSHFDQEAAQSSLYYRLRILDVNGYTENSQIIVIHPNDITNLQSRIYPNPANDRVKISNINSEPGFKVILKNAFGEDLIFQETESSVENNSIELDISALRQGIYFIEVFDAKGRQIHKLIKE